MSARDALLAAGHTEAAEDEAELHFDQHLLHHERGRGEVAPVGAPLAEAARDGVLVAGCAGNLNAAQFAEIDPRVSPLVGHRGGRVAARDAARTRRVRRPRARRARARRGSRDPAGARPSAGRAHARLRQGPGRLRLPLRLLHHPHASAATPARARPRAVLDEVRRRVDEGQPEMVMTGISVGDYRDPERGLELGELMLAVARVPGRRARAAVERRGDPRQRLADRGARHRAEGLPAPTRPDAVRR